MIRRVLGLLLSLSMVLSLIPVNSVYAAETDSFEDSAIVLTEESVEETTEEKTAGNIEETMAETKTDTIAGETLEETIEETVEEENLFGEYRNESSNSGDVSTASELRTALESGLQEIRIISDFQLDQTYYITSDITVYSEETHTITRSPGFYGDLFVVGQNADGTAAGPVNAIFGKNTVGENPLLTIDGNAADMTADVTGSALMISENATVHLYADISMGNHEKKAGATDQETGYGAVINNAGNLSVEGGKYSNNKAVKGGVIYNDGTVQISNAEFSNNTAVEEGGALYGAADASVVIAASVFDNNSTESADSGNGGAISVHSSTVTVTDSVFVGNHSAKSGGALYISYASGSPVNSSVTISRSTISENSSGHQGGAVYVTADGSKGDDTVLSLSDSEVTLNTSAYNGGGIYATSAAVSVEDTDFTSNKAEAAANDAGSRYGGAALYLSNSITHISGGNYTENESDYNAGAIALYSGSVIEIDGITISGNSSQNAGGAIYNSGSTLQVSNSVISSNTSVTGGGAVALYSEAETSFISTQFLNNTSNTNGGALFIYTGATDTTVTDSVFSGNTATQYGGAVYISKASLLLLENVSADSNTAVNGGVLYETTTATQVTIKGLTVSQNSADSGSIIYGNTTKAILNIDKSKYVDLDVDVLDDAYWASAIVNKLTVVEIHDNPDPGDDPNEEVTDYVKSASQLDKAINEGFDTIIIDDDFEIDRTIYVTSSVEIKAESDHLIRRAAGFTGDLFVIGEDSTGNLLSGISFTLGNQNTTDSILTIDGNSENMQGEVNGSVIFITGQSNVTLNSGLVIQNALKAGNVRALSDKYNLGSASHIGGSVAIVESGTFTVNGGEYKNNSADGAYYGGVIYNASQVKIKGGSFHDNSACRGGVISNAFGNVMLRNTSFIDNTAAEEGGVVYSAADCSLTIVDAVFTGNKTTSADDGGGGAIAVHSNTVTMNGAEFVNNSSQRAGGALYLSYASSSAVNSDAVITDASFEGNTAVHFGGAIYATAKEVDEANTVLTIDSSKFLANSSVKGGGAVVAYSNAETKIAASTFESNTTNGNGGALYYYTGAVENTVSNTTFSSNSAVNYGGAIYISNASKLALYSDKAYDNSASNGGYIYITTTATEVTMIGQTVSGNNATVSGPIIYGNTNKAILSINKSNYTDLEQNQLDDSYWAYAIANKITVNDISDESPVEEQDNTVSVDVSSADELEIAINEGKKLIRIVSDFELDRTFYITGATQIYSTRGYTLTRAAGFAGDLFVIGEDASGRNVILDNKYSSLTFGKAGSTVEDLLVIDGNKNNMTVPVTGSVLFVCNSGKVNLYDNTSIINNRKTGNNKTHDSRYNLPYPERIGGAVAIVANGTLNIYGGKYSFNEVNEEAAELSDDDLRTSTIGGAIFNYSNVNIYGGEINNNKAGRGGAIYNYRMANIYQAVLDGNTVSKYGGAVYQAESQFGEILLGRSGETNKHEVIFRNNTAQNSGGAIYSQTKNAVVIYGNTLFSGNGAVKYNGGAINVSGTLTIKRAEFENNYAHSKGGAVYIVNDDEALTTRIINISNAVFAGNYANRGGAIGMMAAESTYAEGGIACFTDCTFSNNRAVDMSGNGSGSDMQGGAIYAIRKSLLSITRCGFTGNSAVDEGGAIYGSGESTLSITEAMFESNRSISSDTGNGGAVAIHSCKMVSNGSTYRNNTAAKSAGALYISYVGSSEKDSAVELNGDVFENNSSGYHGGAVYVTTHIEDSEDQTLNVKNSDFSGNHSSYNAGAIYFTGAKAYLEDVAFSQNSADATANSSGSRYGGGALYLTGSNIEINKAIISNNISDYNGGAIALYSGSMLVGNEITGSSNSATNFGGAVYSNKSTMNLYHSSFADNTSAKGGGAVTLYTEAVSNIYSTEFSGNHAAGNGGALYVYSGSTETMVRDCTFEQNEATSYGGAIYCSNGSLMSIFCNTAVSNTAKNGGAIYTTSTGTTVNLADLTVFGNTASEEGPIIYGNSTKATLNIDKAQYTDLVSEQLDETYWTYAIAGKLTVNDASIQIPLYVDYDHTDIIPDTPEPKDPVPVDDVFLLESITEDHNINSTYNNLPALDHSSNFMSEQETVFEDINGKNVTVDTFVYHPGTASGNPSFGEGVLIYQALLYKKAHPDRDVSIAISSFRFSVEAAVCINRNSKYFGYMRNLGKAEYDSNGFVRISYLLVTAAKMGIHVNVIGQLDAYPVSSSAQDLRTYFNTRLNDPCDPEYEESHIVGDYLDFTYVNWTSYGDDGASDMMHTKVCAVSNYIDINGVEHSGTVWSSSANLDGINANATNGNDKLQTGSIVSDHDALYQVTLNYLRMIAEYGGQEDVYEFRDMIGKITTEQIGLINAGREGEIDPEKQIVYLGSDTDSVFELYFSPYGGSAADWNETYNPFCKYLRKMEQSDDYILFSWTNVKFNKNFALSSAMEEMIIQAFHKNRNVQNRIYILLPTFNSSAFDDLIVGQDIGYKSFGVAAHGTVHSKDVQLSYSENGVRKYVTILNSMNIHQGAMSYQSNFSLVIKEEDCDEDSVFFTIADETTAGIVDHNYGEEQRHEPEGREEGYTYIECQDCGVILKTGIIHNDSGSWIIDKEATETTKGLMHRECMACGEIIEAQEIEIIGQQAVTMNKDGAVGLTMQSEETELYNLPEVVESVPLTFEAEIYLPKSVTARAGTIIGNYAGVDQSSVNLEIYSNGHPRFYMRDVEIGRVYNYIFDYDIRTGKRTHMAVVIDGTKALLYINGVLKETKTITAERPHLSTELTIGGDSRTGNGQYFKGTIYSVNVFSDVRTPEEIKKDVNMVNAGADQLIFSKYFSEDRCQRSASGHIKGEWIVDYEPTDSETGISHRECINCGKILEVIETTVGGESVKTLNNSAAKGLDMKSSETKYVLPSILEDMPMTYEAEIYLPKTVDTRGGIIIGNYTDQDTNSVSFEIKTHGRPRIYYRDADNKKSYSYTFNTDIRGKRIHIAIKLDGNNAILYVDGERVETKAIESNFPTLSTPLCIGSDARDGNEYYFKGTIYSINVFSNVRTDEEIRRDSILVSSNAQYLVYSKYFTGTVCSAGISETTPHLTSEWIIDEEATETTKGSKHIECTVCGDILEVSEIPAGEFAGKHINYNNSEGLSFSSAEVMYPIAQENMTAAPKTIEAVICLPKSFQSSSRGGVIIGNYTGRNMEMSLEVYTNGKPRLFIYNGEKYSYVFNTDIRSDSKIHVAVTADNGVANLFINGELKESIVISTEIPEASSTTYVGGDGRSGNAQYFKGQIYAVHVFSDVRTAEEIALDRIYVPDTEEGLMYGEYY